MDDMALDLTSIIARMVAVPEAPEVAPEVSQTYAADSNLLPTLPGLSEAELDYFRSRVGAAFIVARILENRRRQSYLTVLG